ncbi:MAG: N-acetyl-alpha-D-glucosaminyl L-malate synthase [Syntrophomonadaceae bacterium]|nr:N-acetyl-alpha-D-glucosaminyl L-malate synthase [Bacillota bacterium]
MKIAQVTAYWGPAYPTGSGVFCYEISKRLAKQFEVDVFTSSIGNFNNPSNVGNLHVHPLHTYATIWDMNPVANVFTKLLRNDFDIIHVHSYIFFLSNMAALARLFKRKSRYILHFNGGLDFSGDSQSFHPGRIWAKEHVYDKTLGYFTTKLADRVLSASKSDIPIIRRKFGTKEVKWIPNAVDTERFVPVADKPNPPVVTYVGKLERWKGIDTLIKSFEIINTQVKNVKFLVVGTGSLEGKLREARLPIEFTGPVPYDEMPKIYQRTSVLVLPSYMEGFPVTCIEALSSEVPVIATDVGDTREIVLDGETGFLAKSGDSEKIASHIIKILNDKGVGEKLGKKGRVHVEKNFGYKAVTERIIEEYEQCLI